MIRPAALAAFLATALAAGAAQAIDERDVIGTWRVDAEPYQSDLERAFEAYIAQMPEPVRAQMREMMLGQVDEMYDTEEEVYAEFKAGGEMVFQIPDEPPLVGTWSLSGDRIEFARTEREEDEPAYVGTVADGVMRVAPDLHMTDPEMQPLAVPLPLRRQ